MTKENIIARLTAKDDKYAYAFAEKSCRKVKKQTNDTNILMTLPCCLTIRNHS